MNLAYRERVVLGYVDREPSGNRPPARFEYAFGFYSAMMSQIMQAERFVKGGGSDVERAALLRSAAALMPSYRRAEREFHPEYVKFKKSGVEIEDDLGLAHLSALTRRLEATAPPRQRLFSEVPPAHWAAKAVGDLRALGLLDGYPDGTFRG